MNVQQMFAAHPQSKAQSKDHDAGADPLAAAVEAMLDCAQVSSACADACVAETDARLVQCIRMTLDCADVCHAAASVATRRTGSNATVVLGLLMLAEALTRDCAAECDQHAAHHDHCRLCAEVCRRCEAACHEARLAVVREQMQ